MSELDNLRPEVRSALGAIVRADVCRDPVPTDAFDTIRAELLRLAAMEHAWQQWIKDGMRVEFLPPELPK